MARVITKKLSSIGLLMARKHTPANARISWAQKRSDQTPAVRSVKIA